MLFRGVCIPNEQLLINNNVPKNYKKKKKKKKRDEEFVNVEHFDWIEDSEY